jgi:ABC-type proline/glycine betaine transport system permease subunit
MSLDDYTTLDEVAMSTLEEGANWTARQLPGPVLQICTTLSGYLHHVPEPLWQLYDKIGHVFAMIPASIWNTVPLTLLSTVLGILVVPWTIFQIDDFFGYLADRQRSKIEV